MKHKDLVFFARSVTAEARKSRRTFALWLTLLFPLFTVALVFLASLTRNAPGESPWKDFITGLDNTASFFLPFFLVLVMGFYCNIEHKNNTLKHMLAMPLPKWAFYSGKLAMAFLLLGISMALFYVMALVSSVLLTWVSPHYSFSKGGIDTGLFLRLFLRTYVSGFMIIAVQYWLSFRLRNLIVPIVTGLALIILPIAMMVILGIAGVIQNKQMFQSLFKYDPYAYPFSQAFNLTKETGPIIRIFPPMSLIYMGASFVILFLGYLDFSKKNIR